MRDIGLVNRGFRDLNPLIVGAEQCLPGHRFGPSIRPYTLIHFVSSGVGYFTRGDVTYTVHAGEAFLICPGEITVYIADEHDPWNYHWIGFDGKLTARFETLPAVFPYSRCWADEMMKAYESDGMGEYRIAAMLFEMYAELFAPQKPQNHYIRRVKNYINALYMQPLRIEEIAEKMNLDRRYLSRLFKEKTGMTMQEYLIEVRLGEAKKHLENGSSVSQAARLSGYDDVCNFSKMFKSRFGTSPGKLKKEP